MRGSGYVKPSPPRSREPAQCILDINLEPEPVKEGELEEGEKEDKMLVVLCTAWRHGAKQEME